MSLNTFGNSTYQSERKKERERQLELMEQAALSVVDINTNNNEDTHFATPQQRFSHQTDRFIDDYDDSSDNASLASGSRYSTASSKSKSIERAREIMNRIAASEDGQLAGLTPSTKVNKKNKYNIAPRGIGGTTITIDPRRQHSSDYDGSTNGNLDGGGGCCNTLQDYLFYNRRTRVIISVTITMLLLVIVLAVTLSRADSNGTNNNIPNLGNDDLFGSPGGGGDGNKKKLPIINIKRYDSIRSSIIDSSFTASDDVDLDGTPQNKALRWLTDYDGSNMEVDHIALLQRYALATFFFSTYLTAEINDIVSVNAADAGDVDSNSNDPNSSTNVNSNNNPHGVSISGPSWKHSDHWMSDKGICMWFGVTCPIRLHEGHETNHYNDNADVLHLNLTANNIRGTIPSELSALENLLKLDLGRNNLEGTIPPSLGSLIDLEHLYLIENDLEGNIPSELGKCSSIKNLHFGGNSLTGTVPSSITRLRYMESFGVDENYLSGALPVFKRSSASMLILYLDENQFTGRIPNEYGDMVNVFDLRLAKNRLSGTIPSVLGSLSRLELLYLDENDLTGTIPSEFGNLRRLEELQLYKNHLTGQIPSTIQNLDVIRIMYLDSNELTGQIPSGIGGLSDVSILYMYNNQLSGSLPTEIGNLKNIKDLQIYENQLTGRIPSELGLAFHLEVLYLEDNLLSGSIPTEIGELDHLKSFRFYRNNFSGWVPDEVCDLTEMHRLQFVAGDCDEDEGTIECDCCDECYP